jgi:hypothetical protein
VNNFVGYHAAGHVIPGGQCIMSDFSRSVNDPFFFRKNRFASNSFDINFKF